MPGPAPKAHSLRRGKSPRTDTLATALRVLPRSGRPGDPPAWPMGGKPAKTLLDVWASLWRLPQAVVWEEQGSERVVARYARCLVRAEAAKAAAAVLAEARQLEDRLGLSPMAMLRLRWTVADLDQADDVDAVAGDVVQMADYMAGLYEMPATLDDLEGGDPEADE